MRDIGRQTPAGAAELGSGTMRALILEEPGKISLQHRPIPHPAAGEILIRVKAATTCGTDLKAYLRGHPQIPMPGQFGHEYSGVVTAVGEGAPFAIGDAVMGVHSAPCQTCFWCLRGQVIDFLKTAPHALTGMRLPVRAAS